MVCSKCEKSVPDTEFNYSIENYGIILCRNCQESYKNLEKKHQERKEMATPESKKLYEILVKLGFNAKLELYDGHKHIDIAIPDKKINIEVDGKQHHNLKQALADLKRTYHSFKKNYVTLRIPNILVQPDNIFETASYIKDFLNTSDDQLDKEVEKEN
jgi:very-short-patch-repair endonuclease